MLTIMDEELKKTIYIRSSTRLPPSEKMRKIFLEADYYDRDDRLPLIATSSHSKFLLMLLLT